MVFWSRYYVLIKFGPTVPFRVFRFADSGGTSPQMMILDRCGYASVLIEVVLELILICVVAALGQPPPPHHQHQHQHQTF